MDEGQSETETVAPAENSAGPNTETISDIQNYLASFNKEIQGNDGQETGDSAPTSATTISADADQTAVAPHDGTTEATYYVAEGGQITGFQSFEQNQAQFEGGTTFYNAQFFDPSQGQQGFATFTATTTSESGVTLVPATTVQTTDLEATASDDGVRHIAVTLATPSDQENLQQIVLSATAAPTTSQEGTDGEATEISVTIPASLATHEDSDELLQAVEPQHNESDQPTFVAMQPDGQQVTADQSVTNAEQGIATLIAKTEPGTEGPQVSSQPQTIRMVVQGEGEEQMGPTTAGATIVTSDGQEIQVNDEGTLQMMANLAEQAAQNSADGNNQVILNAGSSYQTVTFVPSESNPNEVSYVLIVSQPEEGKDGTKEGNGAGVGLDMSVYDFEEGEQHAPSIEGNEDEGGTAGGTTGSSAAVPKARIVKMPAKKSQAVSQAHMCNYCNYTSPKRYLLSRHMKSHSEERPHKCSVCERGFKTLASLQNHVNTHTGTRPHQCKECESAFTTSGELVRHVRYKHTHEKPHKCTECDYASVELSKLKRHMRCHTGERPYQCPHCTYASPDTYKLKRHLRIHTGEKPYECDICHARFTQSNSLKAHKLIHSGNKPIFQCELCPTTCGRKTDLRIHVQKLHTSDKPLKCKRCGKSFPDRYTYKVHVKTHEGEKCFKCDLCPYASISQRHLESHMLIHTDQKPYQCDQCDQAFRQKQLLKRHKNLYHDPNYVPPVPKEKTHECPECGRAFRHKGNLIRHMAIHDPEASAQDKAIALRIGRTKKMIGENGEEITDDEETEEEYEDEDDDGLMDNQESITLQANQVTTAEGQQVVVLEVIQLQGLDGDQQAVAVVAGGDMSSALQAAVANSDENVIRRPGRRGRPPKISVQALQQEEEMNTVMTLQAASIDEETRSPQMVVKRGRGRPRKNPPAELEETMDEQTEMDGDEGGSEVDEVEEPQFDVMEGRMTRIRKRRFDEGETYVPVSTPSPSKRGRGRPPGGGGAGRGRKARIIPAPDDLTDSQDVESDLPDEEEIAHREAEAARRRLEQKQKDMDECFGFKDEDEDDDDVLTMQTSNDVVATETAMQILAAMQHVDGNLQQ